LPEEQLQALRQLSAASGRSVADIIRQSVELYLSTQRRTSRAEQVQRALQAAGRFSLGTADGSADHDRHLAES
jgi:predicted DNA-binding protein